MKSVVLCFLLMFSVASLSAQSTPAATPAPAQNAMPPGPMHHPMHRPMGAMPQQHMQEMKAQVEKMRATLEQMKLNLDRVSDPALKQQSQLDVDLWEAMVKHLEGMVSMMSGSGPGMDMMQDGMQDGLKGGMSCGAGMKDGGCCAGMKSGAGCCSGNKCMKRAASAPAAADKPAAQ